jgi:leader peptidase (prepilin peptidase)/N-methyltransferase
VISAGLLGVWFLISTVWLAAIDAKTHRLPNRLVLVALTGQLVLIAVYQLGFQVNEFFVRFGLIAAGALAMFTFYFLVYAASGGKFGLGDVKFSAQFGAVGSLLGLDAWLWLMLTPFVLAGLYSFVMVGIRKMSLSDHIAFGPFMAAGGWLVFLASAGQLISFRP